MAVANHVPCTCLVETHDQPFRGIVDVAKRESCDLIVIGSHGRSSDDGTMLGGQTARLLLTTKMPVLVCS